MGFFQKNLLALVTVVTLLREGWDVLLLNCDYTLQVLQQVVNQRVETKQSLYYGNRKNTDVQVCIL